MKFIQHSSFGPKTPRKYIRQRIRERAHTIAIEESVQWAAIIDDYMSGGKGQFSMKCGLSIVHPNDEFCRKRGIETATDKDHYKKRQFKIVKIEVGDTSSVKRPDGKKGLVRAVVIQADVKIGNEIVMVSIVVDGSTSKTCRIISQLAPRKSDGCGCGGECCGK